MKTDNDHYNKCINNSVKIETGTVAGFPRGTIVRMYDINDGEFRTHAMAGHTADGEWYVETNPDTIGKFGGTLTVDELDFMLTRLTDHGCRVTVEIPTGADTPLAKTAHA